MRRSVSNLEALDATEPYDICIVGAGIAGTVLGLRCVRAGLRVLLLECGSSRSRHWILEPRRRQLAALSVSGDTSYLADRAAPRGIGGSSHAWDGVCERFEPCDFRNPPYMPGGRPWPLSYSNLAAHYARAEQLFRVRGNSHRLPNEKPLPQRSARRVDLAFEDSIRHGGIAVRAPAMATPAAHARTFDLRDELLPEFLASRHAALVSGVTGTRLRADRNGRIVGVTVRTLDGGRKLARANEFVLACGGVQSTRLLLLSTSQRFPRGIGNDQDRVGRGFNDHALLTVSGELPHGSMLRSIRNAQAQQPYRGFRRNGLGAVQQIFTQAPRIAHLTARHTAGRGAAARPAALLRALTSPFDPILSIVGRIETKPVDSNRVTLSRSLTDPFGDPAAHLHFDYSDEDRHLIRRTRELLYRWLTRLGSQGSVESEFGWAGDAIGTCRMGANPAASVCDATLRVHASPNLYLCGAETFPTGGALPPALTIAALADRLADHIIARTRWRSRTPTTTQPRPVPTAPTPAVALLRRRPQH